MTNLRLLNENDIPRILEWMKDPEIFQYFRFDPQKITEYSVRSFVLNSCQESERHYAIVNKSDQYLGTISLKNIDHVSHTAEYAIVLIKNAHGQGIAKKATLEILDIAFNTLMINRIYLNVFSDNTQARKFYENYGFIYEGTFVDHLIVRGETKSLSWYRLLRVEYEALIRSIE